MKLMKVLIIGACALAMAAFAQLSTASEFDPVFDIYASSLVTPVAVQADLPVEPVTAAESEVVQATSEMVLFTAQAQVQPVFRESSWHMGLTAEDTSTDSIGSESPVYW